MVIFHKVSDLQQFLRQAKLAGKSVGFAPTMGALHQGHFSLIKEMAPSQDLSVCSIFVNPTQFNEATDLEKYPRTEEKDVEQLLEVGCDIVFLPTVEEVYPKNENGPAHKFDFGDLDKTMEGAHRPGHFNGVAQVVFRLLEIVRSDRLYMGQKDYQQFSIIREMLRQLKSDVELVVCPIVREADGLAMSSRNALLTPEGRSQAPLIAQTLQWAKSQLNTSTVNQIKEEALARLGNPESFQPEYFEIVDGISLKPVQDVAAHDLVVACTAVRVGSVRLIDNKVLKGKLN